MRVLRAGRPVIVAGDHQAGANTVNNGLRIEGLLRTMHDPRNRLAPEVSNQLLKHFSDKVYDAIIPRNVRLAEAPSFGLSGIVHDKASRGAQAYVQLAEEVIRRDAAPAPV